MEALKSVKKQRVFISFAVIFLLIGLLSASLGVLDMAQNDKIRKDVQSILLKYDEAVPLSEVAVAELNQVFTQKPYNPVRWVWLTYVSIAEHPDYPSIEREGDEEIVYEYRDVKNRFWELNFFGGVSSSEHWVSYYENTALENMWRLDFFSSYTPEQYSLIVYSGTAVCLLVSGCFWYLWAKKRKQG